MYGVECLKILNYATNQTHNKDKAIPAKYFIKEYCMIYITSNKRSNNEEFL
jgi:hypothetical protein